MAQGYVPDLLGEWLRAQDAVQQKRQFEMQQQQVADTQARDAQLRSLGPTVFPQSPELQAVWQADPRLASSIYGQQREFDLKKAMLDAKEAAASVTGDNVGNVNPGDFEPQSIAAWLKSGNSPSTRDYSLLRRVWAPVAPSVANFGGVPGLVGRDPNRGGAGAAGNVTPLATPMDVAGNAGTIAGAEASAKAAADRKAQIDKKGSDATNTLAMLDLAGPLIDVATGSAAGAAYDKLASVFGGAPDGAQAIASLRVLQASLMTSMPRMEGPQSDRDVQLYREAAGQLGEPSVPREIKKAALQTIRKLQEKYKERSNVGSAPPAAIEYLRANPQMAPQFKAKYGYLPDGF